ncbi:hypothetical protein NLU14_13170 [Marinobacter sp. 71-i]|uniref:DUF5666 domain-containing protein n=1 Tax=Marinobacter iranensis TaxID=2962607 RepID=A0ABT5YBY0_9GAMM|nr:hypothetical protein [Marinobacter iranensis]MDF0751175.1 hypothetical protein [Marinobacter iranensis]
MIIRSLPLSSRRTFIMALLAVAALLSGLLASASVQAEERPDDTTLSLNDETFEGTINFVHSDSFMLIINDHSFILERVIRFGGGSWSREQIVKRLAQGDQVRLELGGIADHRTGARAVQRITVLNQ